MTGLEQLMVARDIYVKDIQMLVEHLLSKKEPEVFIVVGHGKFYVGTFPATAFKDSKDIPVNHRVTTLAEFDELLSSGKI